MHAKGQILNKKVIFRLFVLYEHTLERDWMTLELVRGKREKRMRVILTRTEAYFSRRTIITLQFSPY